MINWDYLSVKSHLKQIFFHTLFRLLKGSEIIRHQFVKVNGGKYDIQGLKKHFSAIQQGCIE